MNEEEEIDVDEMRYQLAEQEAMNMNVADIINLLIDGCEGLDDIADIDIIEEYNRIFDVDKDEMAS